MRSESYKKNLILYNLYDFPKMLYEALDVSFVETGCGYRVLVRVL